MDIRSYIRHLFLFIFKLGNSRFITRDIALEGRNGPFLRVISNIANIRIQCYAISRARYTTSHLQYLETHINLRYSKLYRRGD